MTPEESVDKLFSEDFKPLWLTKKERLIKESFEYATTAVIDIQYRSYANKTNKRIIARRSKPIPFRHGAQM